jgi:hypothetical protein
MDECYVSCRIHFWSIAVKYKQSFIAQVIRDLHWPPVHNYDQIFLLSKRASSPKTPRPRGPGVFEIE